ncbi:hypothetical protein CPB85DRAFT_617843 [Mucidula mucida]|nr:hypothetical protein CPB85DRAFT_617843 [Mucidula mucida]
MPPRERYSVRQVNANQGGLDPEVVAARQRRHLDQLERSNHADTNIVAVDDEDGDGKYGKKSRARQLISDKRSVKLLGSSPAATKKKSTMNVRTALLYPKSFATLIEESEIKDLPPTVPTYLTAACPPSKYPPRTLCSVCGYWGHYKCQKCALSYCDMNCESIHNETRCERRVI